MRYQISEPLPKSIKLPLRFREPNGQFEGEVGHPLEIIKQFESQDVLNGAIELVDANGIVLTIYTDDTKHISENTYPHGLKGIYYLL